MDKGFTELERHTVVVEDNSGTGHFDGGADYDLKGQGAKRYVPVVFLTNSLTVKSSTICAMAVGVAIPWWTEGELSCRVTYVALGKTSSHAAVLNFDVLHDLMES